MQLLHDGAQAHRAGATTAYLNANNVNVVNSPPPKPSDLNIIENIWDELNRHVRSSGDIPTTLNQLRAKSLYGCNNHPQNYVQLYVTSMRRIVMPKWTVRGTYLLLSLHGHKRHCKIWLKYIVIFTLFVIFSIKFGLFLSIGKKCDLRFYINFEFCVGIF